MAGAELHTLCGRVHDLSQPCVPLEDSPAGRLGCVYQPVPALAVEHPALTRLKALRHLLEDLAGQELDAVEDARSAGCTWAEIGQAWGTTRQGAYNKWGARMRDRKQDVVDTHDRSGVRQ